MNHKDSGNEKGLEQEFQDYANVFNAIEIIKQAVDNGMSIDGLAKAITGTKNAIDLVSKISDIAVKSTMLELQESVVNLRMQLLDIKESLVEVKEENLELREENKKLKKEMHEQGSTQIQITEENGFHYEGKGKDPICPNCYRNTSKTIILSDTMGIVFKCSKCGYTVNTANSSRIHKRQ